MILVPYERLSRFAGNLATCLEAGVEINRSLSTSKRALRGTRLADALEVAAIRVKQGHTLSEALAEGGGPWPPFFVPLIQAGEQTGRLDEALRYLEHHCRMLAGPARSLRNLWMYPLAIMLAGTFARLFIYLMFASVATTLAFAWTSLKSYGLLGVVVALIFTSPLKPLFDALKLVIPFLRTAERELAMNRFFQVLAMLYATAGRRVESMIRFAALTVGNLSIRDDLLRAAKEIEGGGSMPRAFESRRYLTGEEKQAIASGDLSGTLERTFERISNSAGESLRFRLELIHQVSVRLTMVAVMLTILATVRSLIVAAILR